MTVFLLYNQWYDINDIDRDGDTLIGVFDSFDKANDAAKEYKPEREKITKEEEAEIVMIDVAGRKSYRGVRHFESEDNSGTFDNDIYIVEMEVK